MFQCLTAINSHGLLARCTAHLLDQQALRIVFNTLEGNYALCLLANLVHLAYLQEPDQLASVLCPDLSVSDPGTFNIQRMSYPLRTDHQLVFCWRRGHFIVTSIHNVPVHWGIARYVPRCGSDNKLIFGLLDDFPL